MRSNNMTKRKIPTALCVIACAALALPASADAQRRGGGRLGAGGAGQRVNFNASNRAGRGQARQDLRVRRDANSSVNYNRNVNRNVNRNLNVDVDVHHEYGYGYHWNDHYYHPVARAAVATAAAVTTAAVIGAYYRSLPTNCVTIIRVDVTYYQCGTSWFQPTYVGSSVQYVVVAAP
jgi:hypothetical protein